MLMAIGASKRGDRGIPVRLNRLDVGTLESLYRREGNPDTGEAL